MAERFPYDRSSKWLIQHHGSGLLRLGGLKGSFTWKALQAEVVQPRRLPDGLLEVHVEGASEADYFILEIETYPERELEEQVLRDLALVYLDRGVLPEVMVLVLRPRGNLDAPPEVERTSRLQWTNWKSRWRVVELWTLPADEALRLDDLGVIPWVPLMQSAEPPEVVLQRCRERIDQQARPDERANLLAVTQVLSRLRYNDSQLQNILGGSQAMIESPLIQELLEQRTKQTRCADLLRFLSGRFGSIPEPLVNALKAIADEQLLEQLIDASAVCPDLKAFQDRLESIR